MLDQSQPKDALRDFIERFDNLLDDALDLLPTLHDSAMANQLQSLESGVSEMADSIEETRNRIERGPLPTLGTGIDVVTWDDEPGGFFNQETTYRGEVDKVDGDRISVRMPERIIPARPIPEHTIEVEWRPSVQKWVNVEFDRNWF